MRSGAATLRNIALQESACTAHRHRVRGGGGLSAARTRIR
jgi:hypothetical protein